jgi:protein translocase SecG subunit
MAAILLQSKGQGLSTSFGGGGEYYSSKRGVEKILFWATIIICVLFAITSILVLIL